jgi:hypothetical protein
MQVNSVKQPKCLCESKNQVESLISKKEDLAKKLQNFMPIIYTMS